MIDPDAYADYETWKAKKIAGQIDITISAFNAEAASLALAWEAAAKTLIKAWEAGTLTPEEAEKILLQNPYRKRGMTGAPPE